MKKIICLFLALVMLATLFVACNNTTDDSNDDPNANAQNPTPETPSATTLNTELPINVWTLNGTTGFGMAPLMDSKTKGTAALNYQFTVETAATNVRDALINGTADIGAVPTNVASALFNATNGGVVLLALNTRGVLYLVANTDKVAAPTSLADLAGKTIYCPAQNPAFITNALLNKAAVANVTVDSTTYAEPAALQAAVAAGTVELAVLPEPMVTIAKTAAGKKNITLTAALDLTAEWDNHFTAGSLVQGCVVARKAFVDAHPAEVAKFLEEYKASVEYVTAHPTEASQMIVSAGIFAQAPVAAQAIPKCNLCFITGNDMKTAMSAFLATMPVNSIGGKLPTDAFYYGVK